MKLDEFNILQTKRRVKELVIDLLPNVSRTILYGYNVKQPHIKHHFYLYGGMPFLLVYDTIKNEDIDYQEFKKNIAFNTLLNIFKGTAFYPEAANFSMCIQILDLVGDLSFTEFKHNREPGLNFYGKIKQSDSYADSDTRLTKREELQVTKTRKFAATPNLSMGYGKKILSEFPLETELLEILLPEEEVLVDAF